MRFATVFVFVLAGCSDDGLHFGSEDAGSVTTAFAPGAAEFSAGHFMEAYCSGCHQPEYSSPSGRPVAFFSTDSQWHEPFANPDWFGALDYRMIVKWGDAIRCGVQPSVLPESCLMLPEVVPGFFAAGPEKFPPPGDLSSSAYGATPPPICAYAPDGHTCPQPSEGEREALVRWIDAGFPR